MIAVSGPEFPVRSGNEFRLLVNGPVFFPRMLDAIREASRHVVMEMYLVQSGRIAADFSSAFIAAAQRGVTVQLLLDAFGSRLFTRRDRERLVQGGVQLVIYNPLRLSHLKRNLFRTHRKFLVVDGTVAYVGGSGIADVFTGETGWRETMIEARGPVVSDWQNLFIDNWINWSQQPVKVSGTISAMPANQRGRVVWTESGSTGLEIKRALLNRTRNARERVWIASAYFVPSRKLRRALRRAAIRGVDARLLLPGPITDHPAVRFASRRFYARLLRHGVRIFEYEGRFMHSKVALADNWCSIGSSNMDRWNFRWNLEANQEIDDAGFAGDVSRMLQDDFSHCREIEYRQWLRRSRMHRLKEWLWGKVDTRLAQWLPRGTATGTTPPEMSGKTGKKQTHAWPKDSGDSHGRD
jgi:phosphatidylserine/phosphatidylglycerophosphate/cardiolipin synthase-like enzyme